MCSLRGTGQMAMAIGARSLKKQVLDLIRNIRGKKWLPGFTTLEEIHTSHAQEQKIIDF